MVVGRPTFDEPVVCPVLLGRDGELDALRQVAAGVAGGRGQVVLVAGEAGIGKSRLVRELAAGLDQDGWVLLQSNCFERDRGQPYGPVAELLRRALGSPPPPMALDRLGDRALDLARVLPELRRWLPAELEPGPSDPEQDRRRLFQVMVEVLGESASQAPGHPSDPRGSLGTPPALIVVEDAHWADDASLEFVQRFARTLAGRRVLLVLTYRSDEMDGPLRQLWADLDRERLLREVRLAPLETADVDAMLRAILGSDRLPRRDFSDVITSLTEGNPFFVEELVRSLIADGQLVRDGGVWARATPAAELRVPRTVLAAVQRRAERLSDRARQVLDLAAVVGQQVEFEFVRGILGWDEAELLSNFKELVGAGLLVERSAERLAFRHALTRQAILGQLLARERRLLHRRVVEQLRADGPEHLAELAEHAYAAGLWALALDAGRRAGEQALSVYAPGAAVEHYSRAIDAAGQLGASAEPGLLRARGQAHEALGDFLHARADFEQALAVADDPALRWQLLLDLGSLWASRDYAQAGRWFEQAVEVARQTGDRRQLARSLNRLGNWLVNIGRTAEGLELHRQALPLLQAEQDRAGVAETEDLLGMALGLHGDVVAAVEWFGRAVDGFRALGDRRGLASSLASYATFGAPLLAETTAAALRTPAESRGDGYAALQLARESGSLASEVYARFALAQTCNGFGELGDALEHGQAARRIAAEIDHPQWQTGALCVLGESYVFALAPERAIAVLEPACALARELRSDWWLGFAASYLALARLLAGDLLGARSALQGFGRAIPEDRRSGWPPEHAPATAAERRVAWAWGELALAERAPAEALRIAQVLLESAPGGTRDQGVPWLHKLVGEAYLALRQLDAAQAALDLARAGALERAQRPALWQMHRAWARLHLRRRAHEAAYAETSRARAVVEDLAATLPQGELRGAFLDRALATLPRTSPSVARRVEFRQLGGLSPREREVAQLVAQGRSNREIAEALVVGERTVETHVSSILAKLGLGSRHQVAARLAEGRDSSATAP
jgi:DNA-binding CsgD family transcriptional regulator/tetratricopeptide (TPR) repeat protein